MDEFIRLLDQDYELMHYRMKDRAIVFEIQSRDNLLIGRERHFCGMWKCR